VGTCSNCGCYFNEWPCDICGCSRGRTRAEVRAVRDVVAIASRRAAEDDEWIRFWQSTSFTEGDPFAEPPRVAPGPVAVGAPAPPRPQDPVPRRPLVIPAKATSFPARRFVPHTDSRNIFLPVEPCIQLLDDESVGHFLCQVKGCDQQLELGGGMPAPAAMKEASKSLWSVGPRWVLCPHHRAEQSRAERFAAEDAARKSKARRKPVPRVDTDRYLTPVAVEAALQLLHDGFVDHCRCQVKGCSARRSFGGAIPMPRALADCRRQGWDVDPQTVLCPRHASEREVVEQLKEIVCGGRPQSQWFVDEASARAHSYPSQSAHC